MSRRGDVGPLLVAAILIGVGSQHFIMPKAFDASMPPILPESTHRPLTYLSGVAEVAAGALLVSRQTRPVGGRLAFWVLLAIWPANIASALSGGQPGLTGWAGSAAAAWIRVPLQVPMLWIAHRASRAGREGDTPS